MCKFLVVFAALSFLVANICIAAPRHVKTPIVIVPGIGGSQIEAKLHRSVSPHYWCYKIYKDWFTVWLSIEELAPLLKYCWVDNMKLIFNNATGKMENTPGVETRNPGFGNTSGIEWLDPFVHYPGVYFFPLVDSLTRLLNYERGKTLRAAPYDFRYDPDSSGNYFERLKNLIEDTFQINNGKRILLLSHSMGVPYTLRFLHQQSQEWMDKHIKAWTTISGVFAGSVKAVKAYVSGEGFGIPKVLDSPVTLRSFQRTFSSMPFILPDARFWKSDEILVKTFNRSYTVDDYDDLFADMGYPLASKIAKTVPKAWSPEPPNIKMYCFHGSKVATPGMLTYKDGYFPDYPPDITMDDGDGTVNIRSLEACQLWREKQQPKITYQVFPFAEHNGILGDTRLIRALVDVITADD